MQFIFKGGSEDIEIFQTTLHRPITSLVIVFSLLRESQQLDDSPLETGKN